MRGSQPAAPAWCLIRGRRAALSERGNPRAVPAPGAMMDDVTDDAAGHLLRNIFAAPAEPGPPYVHTVDLSPPSLEEAMAWLRDEITWWLEYARKEAARRPITPMRSHEMRDLIATSEAHLALLDEHYILTREDRNERYDEYSVVTSGIPGGGGDQGMGCVTCHYKSSGRVAGYGICPTVRFLASAYRHREGYERYWGTPATYTISEGDQ